MSVHKNDRRYWGVIVPSPASVISMLARQAEEQGLEGVFAPQAWGSPFTSLAVAASHTERIKVASGIAIAAARSPFETAMTAIDMDHISNGRFILGLGTSVAVATSGMFGVPNIKPLSHLRETVSAIRHIIAAAHKGLEPFQGEYYIADFKWLEPQQPPLREEIPIWLGALRGPAIRLAAEIADGIIGHPIWSVEWAVREAQSEIASGLVKAGRKREDVELNLWFYCAPNENEKDAIEDARVTVAFYASAEQYEPYFAAHGFLDEVRQIQQAALEGNIQGRNQLVTDEMVRAFVICGKPDHVRKRVEQAWSAADSICLVPPAWGLSPETIVFYQNQIAKFLY